MAFNVALTISNIIDTFYSMYSKGIKSALSDYSSFETALDNNIIISENGECYSLLKLNGALSELTSSEFSDTANELNKRLTAFFKDDSHTVQFVYRSTPDNDFDLTRRFKPIHRVAADLQLDIADLLDSRQKLIANKSKNINIYVLIGTVSGDSKDVVSEERKDSSSKRSKMFLDVDSQSVFSEIISITNKHNSFLGAISSIFKSSGISVAVADSGLAINIIRGMFNEKLTHPTWRPSMPGKILNLRMPENPNIPDDDVSELLWSKVSTQIFPSGIEHVKRNICNISGVYYYSIEVTIPPQTIMVFSELVNSIPDNISTHFSISMFGGGQDLFSMKKMLSAFGAAISSQNRAINDSFNVLTEMNNFHGESMVSWKMSALVWADSYNKVKIDGDSVVGALQTWGSPMVIPARIGSIQGLMNAMPIGASTTSSGMAIAPLYSALKMLPIETTFCPWANGSCTFLTQSKTPYYFQTGSSIQTTWNDIIFATPGSGKSVLMNYLNFSTILTPGNTQIPYIGIVDIGFSSKGLIELVKNSLPSNKRHLAIYHQLENNAESCINIFDTQLGLREPTSVEEAFIVNFITLLLTPPGKKSPFDTASAIATLVVREMYSLFSDNGNMVRNYEEYLNEEIDDFMSHNGIWVNESTTWWEIVDRIYEMGNIPMAKLAQRYAVPRLQECISVLRQSETINDMYGKILLPSQESVISAFSRSITEAIAKYKLLSGVTSISFDSARIISLDLQKVALQGNAESQHQSAVMYLVSRYIIGKNFFIDSETIEKSPEQYKSYHGDIISSIKSVKKRICFDEFHRTSGIESIENQVVRDMREGRKWNIQIALASQMLDDFSKNICDIASCTYIMSGGHTYASISNKFNLSAAATNHVKSALTGPSSSGTPFVFIANTRKGRVTQLLNFMATSSELWAFNTNAEDFEIKEMVTSKLGFQHGIRALANSFPGGSTQDAVLLLIERGLNKQEARDRLFDDTVSAYKK